MSEPFIIDIAQQLVLSRAAGVFTDAIPLAHDKRLQADPRFVPSMRQLVDFRSVTVMDTTPDGLRQLASFNPFGDGARRAVIAPTDITYGLARMYEMMRDGHRDVFQVFRTPDEAIEWLGLVDEREHILSLLDGQVEPGQS